MLGRFQNIGVLVLFCEQYSKDWDCSWPKRHRKTRRSSFSKSCFRALYDMLVPLETESHTKDCNCFSLKKVRGRSIHVSVAFHLSSRHFGELRASCNRDGGTLKNRVCELLDLGVCIGRGWVAVVGFLSYFDKCYCLGNQLLLYLPSHR